MPVVQKGPNNVVLQIHDARTGTLLDEMFIEQAKSVMLHLIEQAEEYHYITEVLAVDTNGRRTCKFNRYTRSEAVAFAEAYLQTPPRDKNRRLSVSPDSRIIYLWSDDAASLHET